MFSIQYDIINIDIHTITNVVLENIRDKSYYWISHYQEHFYVGKHNCRW